MGKYIYFKQGIPDFEPDVNDIDPLYSNIIVLDDLMDIAVDSPIISKLFTQGRHRNASVILLLKMHFQKESTIPAFVATLSIWHFSGVLWTGGK